MSFQLQPLSLPRPRTPDPSPEPPAQTVAAQTVTAQAPAKRRLYVNTSAYWLQMDQKYTWPVSVPSRPPRQQVGCDNHQPDWVVHDPRPDLCPELLRQDRGGEPVRVVEQSKGVVTCNWPAVSLGFTGCAAFLFLNEDTGQTLLIHHDSGVRANWNKHDQKLWGEPVSPATPTGELLGRDRMAYKKFLETPGHKRVMQIESLAAFERADVLRQIVDDGVQALKPLILRPPAVGPKDPAASWSMVYRPVSDELLILVKAGDQSTLMRFSGLMQETLPVPLSEPDDKAGGRAPNLVEDLAHYREAVARVRDRVSPAVSELLTQCLDVATARSSNLSRAYAALRKVVRDPLVPPDMARLLVQGSVVDRNRRVMTVLTALVDHLLAQAKTQDPAPGD